LWVIFVLLDPGPDPLTRLNPDPQPCPQDESSAHDVNQRHVLLYGSGRGRDESSKQCRKLSKELLKLFGKRFSIDVYDCGKVAGIFITGTKNPKKIGTLLCHQNFVLLHKVKRLCLIASKLLL
jgi:hypothetical protein